MKSWSIHGSCWVVGYLSRNIVTFPNSFKHGSFGVAWDFEFDNKMALGVGQSVGDLVKRKVCFKNM